MNIVDNSLIRPLNDQKQVFRLLYAIWPKSKDLYPTYLKATQPPSILGVNQVTSKLARLLPLESKVSIYYIFYYALLLFKKMFCTLHKLRINKRQITDR